MDVQEGKSIDNIGSGFANYAVYVSVLLGLAPLTS